VLSIRPYSPILLVSIFAAMAISILVLQILQATAVSLAPQRSTPQFAGAERAKLTPQQRGTLHRYKAEDNEEYDIGKQNRVGVTKYSKSRLHAAKSNTTLWWPDSTRRTSVFEGASDLGGNVSWGWHHPNGIYGTIPVGAPLIDANSNIYLASDDAVRKFTSTGDLEWSYAPRGQVAAAPSLVQVSTSARRSTAQEAFEANLLHDSSSMTITDEVKPALDRSASEDMEDTEAEEELQPEWARANQGGVPAIQLFSKAKVGDRVKVRPGVGYSDGKEYYQAGETGEITEVLSNAGEKKAVIEWRRTGRKSTASLDSMGHTFRRLNSKAAVSRTRTILVGSTTSGYVFAIDVDTGDEMWVTQASDQIAGVKGTVSGYGDLVFVATNRCVDRYCYRYRSDGNPITPGNTFVRALSAVDGSLVWTYRTKSPLWNFVPQYSKDADAIFFNDYEGAVYSVDIETGALKWRREGSIGTHTESSCVYNPEHDMVFGFGVDLYVGEACNPFVVRGIQKPCDTKIRWPGYVRAFNASSGHLRWEVRVPEPPSSAAVGYTNTPKFHLRLVVSMGYNCAYGATSQLWSFDPSTGQIRWKIDGPTLWTPQCAGDREGADLRRVMAGRERCQPGAWSTPIIDGNGDIYIGSQVGVLQRFGADDSHPLSGSRSFKLLSTLNTEMAFQDQAIALAPNIMAVSTCTSLIVFQTNLLNETFAKGTTWEYEPIAPRPHGYGPDPHDFGPNGPEDPANNYPIWETKPPGWEKPWGPLEHPGPRPVEEKWTSSRNSR